jgi:hypothetical protein
MTTFPEGRERNLALGIWGAASGSGGAAGVLLGGLTPSSGRLALAAAVVCLAAGLRADGRRILPGR